jgi:hypothetical protein
MLDKDTTISHLSQDIQKIKIYLKKILTKPEEESFRLRLIRAFCGTDEHPSCLL